MLLMLWSRSLALLSNKKNWEGLRLLPILFYIFINDIIQQEVT